VAFSADGALIATGSNAGTVRLWDAATGDELMVLGGHQAPVTSLAFDNADGLLSAAFDGETRLWNIGPNQAGFLEFTAHPVEESPSDDAFVTLRFNQTGDRLVTLNGYDAAKLWDLTDLANPVELSSVKKFFATAIFGDFSEDGTKVAIGAVDSEPRVFDADTGALLMTLDDVDTEMNRGVAFSPDGSRLVTGSGCCGQDPNGAPKIWDLVTGRVLTRLEHRVDLWEVDWSPDGSSIATAGEDGAVRVWDPETGEERYAISGGYGAVRFSPDGTLLATAGQDLKVWDSATGVEILAFEGHAGLIAAIDFSPDGSQLISGGLDALAKIWDVATGVEVQTLTKHPRAVTGVAWGSDGIIATVSDLGDVRLHIRDLDALERIARQRVTRSLTEAECRQYLHVEGCPTP
jgi:WD40 repeat protein